MQPQKNSSDNTLEKFMEMNVFLADYVHGSTNRLEYFLSSESYQFIELDKVEFELGKMKLGDILLLKFNSQTRLLTFGAIGFVRGIEGGNLTVQWSRFNAKVKISDDEVYKRDLIELVSEPKSYIYEQLKQINEFTDFINVVHSEFNSTEELVNLNANSFPKLKHALSIEENDENLLKKGYFN